MRGLGVGVRCSVTFPAALPLVGKKRHALAVQAAAIAVINMPSCSRACSCISREKVPHSMADPDRLEVFFRDDETGRNRDNDRKQMHVTSRP